ncbi:unnamed protein product [Leptidea sinapis]|uniref:Uncharacterized protein n=1 Tax=Leptidea sinapis TaxID=189913 RepID=A0A5E4PXM8_9NEOP|nr:unnamed protein product [Leptidea sinapis]
MATRVSIEGTGPSYASVLNLGGVESNKENIESTESVVETPPRHDNEEEEGFVPVISHTRRPAKHRRDRERRAQPRPPKAPQASHTDSQPAADQAQSSEDQPKKFVEAPIPKVNPWQVRGGSTGVPPPLPPVLHDAEKRSPLLPQQQQPKPPPTPVAPKPTVVKAVKTTKVNQKASDFTDIGDWPTLGAAVAGARCHSTPPPHEADPTHHNGNADQERKPPEEPKPEKVEQVNHQPNVVVKVATSRGSTNGFHWTSTHSRPGRHEGTWSVTRPGRQTRNASTGVWPRVALRPGSSRAPRSAPSSAGAPARASLLLRRCRGNWNSLRHGLGPRHTEGSYQEANRVLLQPGKPVARFLPAPQDGAGRHDPGHADCVIPPRARAHSGRSAGVGRDPRLGEAAALTGFQGSDGFRTN